MSACIGFPPVARLDARVLICGSLPGGESLLRRQYYAKPQNSFWKIMGELFGAVPTLPYEDRLKRLTQNHIALWDVCASAQRQGSLDSNIEFESVAPNDFASFLQTHRHIQLIAFNGQHAEKLFRRLVLDGLSTPAKAIPRITLPSTSPAHAGMRFEAKLEHWKIIKEKLEP